MYDFSQFKEYNLSFFFTDMGWFKRKTAVSSSPIEKVMEVSLDNAHIFFLHF